MKTAPTEPWIPILFTVLLLLGLGIAIGIAGQAKFASTVTNSPDSAASPSVSPSATPPPMGSVKFSGTLTADECITSNLPVGDVGCSITVDNKYIVTVEHGNAYSSQPWGTLIGFPDYPKSPVGSAVEVYAHEDSQSNFSLGGSAAYYVKISN